MTEKIPGIYTIVETAELLGKSERQVWRYIHDKDPEYRLKSCVIGSRQFVTEQDLNEFKKRIEKLPSRARRPKKQK